MVERKASKAQVVHEDRYVIIKDVLGAFERHTIPSVLVIGGGEVLWKKSVYPFFKSAKEISVDLHIPKPFQQERLKLIYKKAQRIADKHNKI